jgi:hypothetical protein
MREDLPFDDLVKKHFSDYSPDVPAHIWENIIAKRKSRPKGFWMNMISGGNILILSGILLIGGGASYFLISNHNSINKNIVTEKVDKNITSQKTATKTIDATSGEKVTDNTISKTSQDQNTINDVVSEQSANTANSSNQNNSFATSFHKKGLTNIKITGKNNEINNEETFPVDENNKEISTTIVNSPFKFSTARELSTNKISNSANVKLPECPALEKNAAGNKTYWEVYAGPDYAFDNYKSYGDTASTNYLQKRKASTKFASAFSAGIRYTKVFDNGTSVRAGVNYTQVNEKFVYFNPNEIKNVTVITTRVIIRSPGDTIYINDTLQYQQTGSRTKTTYNRYRNIDIPLVIGYELGNGKIHVNLNAGVIINIYSWYKGDVLDSLYQPVTITTGKGNSIYQFKNNIGVGFLGSISVYYKLTDNLHLLLEPYFRYNLSPMSKQNLNLQQKNNIAGLRAGVRLDLK